jgi:DNA-directed RNA polymerase subunit beta'
VGPIVDVPKVKGAAYLATNDGFVHIVGRALLLLDSDEAPLPLAEYRTFGEPAAGGRGAFTLRSDKSARVYALRAGQEPRVASGAKVQAGDALTTGLISVHDLIDVMGERFVRAELGKRLSEAQVTLSTDVLDALLTPLFSHVEIVELGDSDFLQNEVVTAESFMRANEQHLAAGRRPAIAKQVVLGYSELAARLA